MISELYKNQVNLLLDVLPIVAKQEVFALKGGTALNLFYSNMPRLSVDIDLCYMSIKNRKDSYGEIHEALSHISKEISKLLEAKVTETKPLFTLKESRLIVERDNVKIKVEPNYVIRGALFPVKSMVSSKNVGDIFQKEAQISCLSEEDLWGGKFCAALDRQHPRDLFDVNQFLKKKACTFEVKSAFIFYLLSHNRPIEEVLDPNQKDISETYRSEFEGMSFESLGLDMLEKAFADLKKLIHSNLNDQDKRFLISFYMNQPDWSLFEYGHVAEYPSIKWKLQNISRMTLGKRLESKRRLEQLFSG